MKIALILLVDQLLSVLAPIVTLFYRGGWFNTPDDPVSPRGLYEPFMRKLHDKVGPWWSDYWWLGWRNKAYGWSYAMKPAIFKGLDYRTIKPGESINKQCWAGPFLARRIVILGHTERCFTLICFRRALFTLIVGYRLRPVWDELWRNAGRQVWDTPHRPVNMDARPILSIRFGYDD